MCTFRRAEKSLACSCVDPFPLLRFHARVNFGAPKSRSMRDFLACRKAWDVYTDIMRMRMTLLK